MANLTITVDDQLLRQARVRAAELGTSVNAVLRDYMQAWVGASEERNAAIRALVERSERARSARGRRRWSRDELHER
jgi:plasmid stability protein